MTTSKQQLHVNKGFGDVTALESSGWNILNEEVGLPVAVLDEASLQSNAQWMQSFSEQAGVKLAPHGKTTMSPELFKQQLSQGCWGISLATIPQVVSAYKQGVKRFILANQLIGKFHCQQLVEILQEPDVEFYCFVESVANVVFLGEFFQQQKATLNVLIEIGVPGGRCGWRDVDNIRPLVDAISAQPALQLSGISFYEGVIHGEDAQAKIVHFIERIKQLFIQLQQQGRFNGENVIITGAGSAWYDVVANALSQEQSLNFTAIIRPGCYLIHDTGIYQDAQQTIMQRSQLACDIGGDLISSLYVWAYVYATPEPGLVIVGLGKRDAAFDAGLPTPTLYYRPGNDKPQQVPDSWESVKIMDQHLMLKVDENADLQPGDMMCFSTSHPCLTFDKWRFIGISNDQHVITKQVATYF
ncbi:amino acid deaminase [Thalassotalea sp. 1_MG-2023]|uniref:amino acid deaminase n=1 Tax=Thalassotalea sp. 1_MG-2023 TaxID=3062680 RepID=UPI0026E487DE|nr:amino acid deaminase [Thalassotalea sp. 1_MG-2023]MDO6425551.1 amino acid deaminase [Thalassotalea sp. 1_MG-2023]